jgi:hypothetical protein
MKPTLKGGRLISGPLGGEALEIEQKIATCLAKTLTRADEKI